MDYVSYSNSLAIIYIKALPCKSRIDSSRLSKRLTQFSQTSPGKITKFLWMTNPGQYSKVSSQNNCWENFFSPHQIIFDAFELTSVTQMQFFHTQKEVRCISLAKAYNPTLCLMIWCRKVVAMALCYFLWDVRALYNSKWRPSMP